MNGRAVESPPTRRQHSGQSQLEEGAHPARNPIVGQYHHHHHHHEEEDDDDGYDEDDDNCCSDD